jgi:hypothetical protein
MSFTNQTLDTSDVDRWIGKPIVFAEFWDPCNATDIRRWVQAMDYANPLHWDEEFARPVEVRRHRRAAELHRGDGLWPWLPPLPAWARFPAAT